MQGPIATEVFVKTPTGGTTPAAADPAGLVMISGGGTSSLLDITAAAVVKGSAGRLTKIVVVAPGTTGGFSINDAATTGAATATNLIFTLGISQASVGQVIALDWPCANGIVVSAVPSAGSPIINIAYA